MRATFGFTSIVLTIFGLLLTFAAPARAQSQEVIVRRRDGNIRIQTNGDVRVEETWQVQFVGGPFRFAFRSDSAESCQCY